MNKIKILEVKRLLKELDYIESDFEYRSEVISEADSEFIKCVNEFLKDHPELKEIYDKKINEKINETIKNKTHNEQTESNTKGDGRDSEEVKNSNETESDKDENSQKIQEKEENIKEVVSPKLKKLYREIVKLTHPDKVKKKKLNELYLEATMYYDNNDKIGIYKVCSELDIEYDFEEEDEDYINHKIQSLKKRIGFLESTFTWKWYRTENESDKNQILMNYIKLRLQ